MDVNKFPLCYQEIVEEIKPSGAFLVGGAVRDLLLDKNIHDLDFALPDDSILYARKVADRLGGNYYLLDKERKSGRVIVADPDQKRLIIDFTLFQGDSLEEDLRSRDFTITSMAMDPNRDHQLIDLFQGVNDLKERLIRSTTNHALRDDPLRCVRAVRMAAQLGFRILPETKKQIRESASCLSAVSPERTRDELFKVFAGPNQAAALDALGALGLFSKLFTFQLTKQKRKTSRKLEELWNILLTDHDQDSTASWAYGLYVHRLGRYRDQLATHLQYQPVPGRSAYQLGFFLPLLLDTKGDPVKLVKELQSLSLSNQELDRMSRALAGGVHFYRMVIEKEKVEPIDAYRYFRDYHNAGVEGIFLGLAYFLAAYELLLVDSGWEGALDTARTLLEGWWEKRKEWIDPPTILNGDDLINEFGIEPGPQIGYLLEQLRERQVEGEIDDRSSALKYVKTHHKKEHNPK